MDAMPEGWYHDPAPANPATPTTMRFWDGKQWTARTRAASRGERAQRREEMALQQAAAARAYADQLPQGGYPAAAPAGQWDGYAPQPGGRDATPDGQQLAGWWARAGALVIDGIITTAVAIAFSWRFIQQIVDGLRQYLDLATEAAQRGAAAPDGSLLTQDLIGPIAGIGAVTLAVKLLYGVGFLKAFAATPGKMVVGLEVRLSERPGPLSWGTVLVRWLVQNLGSLIQLVPVVGLVGSVLWLLNYLWPTWDGRRQALHDKAAHTNVVRRG
jgi:uncharacterized RDD family membrane protein YckC